jgi:WD40 repeat protein
LGSTDGSALVWDIDNPAQSFKRLTGHTGSVIGLAFDRVGNTLASASNADASVILWNLEANSSNTPLNLSTLNAAQFYSPHGYNSKRNLLAVRDANGTSIWDVADPAQPKVLTSSSGSGTQGFVLNPDVVLNPEGTVLATVNPDPTITLWDVSTPGSIRPLSTLTGYSTTVETVAFSPDGKLIASRSDDDTKLLWDVSDPRGPVLAATIPLNGSGGQWSSKLLAFAPDEKKLLVDDNRSIVVYDISNPKTPKATTSPFGYGLIAALHPQKPIVAMGNIDGIISLWDISTQKPFQVGTLKGHSVMITGLAFNSNGNLLASGSDDSTVTLWDITIPERPVQYTTLTGHRGRVAALVFLNDSVLASSSWDNSVILWSLDPAVWIQKACQIVGRNLTRSEWARYFGDRGEPYRKTCDQWPEGQ